MSHPIVERILSGQAPPQLKQAAARGALPIPREDIIELWVLLRSDADEEVRMACKENLAEVSESEWKEILPVHAFDPRALDFYVRVLGKNQTLLQAVLKNKGVPTETLEWLALNTTGPSLDVLLDNQVRLISSPSIVVAMLANSGLEPTQVRRIFDLAEQFFRDHSEIPALLELRFGLKLGHAGGEFAPELSEEEAAALPVEGEEDLRPEDFLADPEVLAAAEAEIPPEALADDSLSQEAFDGLYQRILSMSIPAKISLALKGNREARGLLIRDSNRVVQAAVLESPKLTDAEVEGMAKLRSLSDDLMRKIARNKEWIKKYPVLKALATNPKTPPGLAIVLLNRLLDFDLKMLLKDKNVGEIVRREAKRIYIARTTRKVISYRKGG